MIAYERAEASLGGNWMPNSIRILPTIVAVAPTSGSTIKNPCAFPFHETSDFVKEVGIDTANFCILTPIPGTPMFEKLERENRIITHDWSKYTRQHITFQPLNMTPFELATGRLSLYKKFYSLRSMVKRMPFRYPHIFWFWLYNISFRIGIHRASKSDMFVHEHTHSHAMEIEKQHV